MLAFEVYQPALAKLIGSLAAAEARATYGWSRPTPSTACSHLLEPESIDELWMFFPDPWPKARHHKRRILSPALRRAGRRPGSQPGGRWRLATDWADYADQMRDVLDPHSPVPQRAPQAGLRAGRRGRSPASSDAASIAGRRCLRPCLPTRLSRVRARRAGAGAWTSATTAEASPAGPPSPARAPSRASWSTGSARVLRLDAARPARVRRADRRRRARPRSGGARRPADRRRCSTAATSCTGCRRALPGRPRRDRRSPRARRTSTRGSPRSGGATATGSPTTRPGPIRCCAPGAAIVAPVLDLEAINARRADLIGLRDFAAFCRRRAGRDDRPDAARAGGRPRQGGLRRWWSSPSGPTPSATRWCDPWSALWSRWDRVAEDRGVARRTAGRPRNATAAVPVLPARGLTLEEVGYPPDDRLGRRGSQPARTRRELPDD